MSCEQGSFTQQVTQQRSSAGRTSSPLGACALNTAVAGLNPRSSLSRRRRRRRLEEEALLTRLLAA